MTVSTSLRFITSSSYYDMKPLAKIAVYCPIHTADADATQLQRSTEFRLRFRFRRRMWTHGHFRRTFGFGRKQSYHIRCTFGFGVLLLVNSVVAKSRVQSSSCGDRECARRRESLASLCTDWLCKDNRGSWLRCLRLHLVLHVACGPWQAGINGTIDFRFWFSAESKTSAFGRPLLNCRVESRRRRRCVLAVQRR